MIKKSSQIDVYVNKDSKKYEWRNDGRRFSPSSSY